MIEVDESKLMRCPVCDAVNIDKGKKNELPTLRFGYLPS